MQIKPLLIVAVLATAILFSAGFVNAQTAPTQEQLTQQLIQLLTQMIAQLEQEIQLLLAAQQHVPSTICTPNWTCSWSQCVNGIQTHSWTDLNNCGTTLENVGVCSFLTQACSPSVQPSAKVISPNGGETWQIGQTYVISYALPATTDYASIFLDKYDLTSSKPGPNSSIRIAASTVGQQSVTYTVDSMLANWPGLGSSYKLKVCRNEDYNSCDSSDGYLSVVASVQPTITASLSRAQYTAGERLSLAFDIVNAPSGATIEMDIKASKMSGGAYTLLSTYLLDGTTRTFDLSAPAPTTFPSHGTITWTTGIYDGYLPMEGPLEIFVKSSSGLLLAKTEIPVRIVAATTNTCSTADYNNDGKVNSADNDLFVSLFQSNNARTDICGTGFVSTSWYADGKVTSEDYDCFLDLYQRCKTN